MGKILDWFAEMEKANPSFITNVDPNPPKVINNYYITIDNRVIKVNEQEFRNYLKKQKLVVDTSCRKLLE